MALSPIKTEEEKKKEAVKKVEVKQSVTDVIKKEKKKNRK